MKRKDKLLLYLAMLLSLCVVLAAGRHCGPRTFVALSLQQEEAPTPMAPLARPFTYIVLHLIAGFALSVCESPNHDDSR